MEADGIGRCRGSNIFQIGSEMALRLSALSAGRPLPPRMVSGTHFCYRLSRPRTILWLEWLSEFKNLVTTQITNRRKMLIIYNGRAPSHAVPGFFVTCRNMQQGYSRGIAPDWYSDSLRFESFPRHRPSQQNVHQSSSMHIPGQYLQLGQDHFPLTV
jgi:hypothetical protein